MSEPNTPQRKAQSPTDEQPDGFRLAAPPVYGWFPMHHSVNDVLMQQHSTVVKVYVALGRFVNQRREAYPSYTTLAQTANIDRRTVIRAMNRLIEIGLIERIAMNIGGAPDTNHYRWIVPSDTHDTRGSVTHDTRGSVTHDTRGSVTHDTQTRRISNKKEFEQEAPIRQQGNCSDRANTENDSVKDNGSAHMALSENNETKDSVSTQDDAHLRELNNPYWLDPEHGEARRVMIRAIIAEYPKKESETDAIAAYRQTIGTRLDGLAPEHPAYRAVWFGVQWYSRKVAQEQTEPKYIPKLGNWIRGERWNDAPRDVLKGRVHVAD